MSKIKYIIALVFALVMCLFVVSCDDGAEEPTENMCRHEQIIDSDVPVTCDCEGYKLHTCAECGASYKTNRVAPTGHSYKKSVTAPTCEKQGYTTYTCDCGFKYTSDIIEPLGHTYTQTVTQPTCATEGYTTYVCDCDFTYVSDFVKPLGHKYTEAVTSPTCTDEGYTTYSCKCGDTYVSNHVIPKSHTYVSTVVAPTCTENGYTENVCECGESYLSNFVSFTGHTYTKEVTPPTCEIGGYTVYTCDCGHTYTSDHISPLGHTLEENITPATCTDQGYTTFTCHCGYSFVAEYTMPTGHSFSVKNRVFASLSSTGYCDYACDCSSEYRGDYLFYRDIVSGAYSNSTEILAKGIDVSKWQHNQDENEEYIPLNWENIKNEGVEFAILRAGTSMGADPVFEMNYAGAKAAEIDLGVYFYSYATTIEAIEADAYVLLNYLYGKQFEYPIYLDLEDPSQEGLDAELLTQMCIRFFDILQSQGYYVALYTNNSWLTSILDTQFVLDNFDVWYARYPISLEGYAFSSEEMPLWNTELYGENLGMWQFTSTGILEAIPECAVDINVAYKDYPSIIKAFGLNGYGDNESTDASEDIELL